MDHSRTPRRVVAVAVFGAVVTAIVAQQIHTAVLTAQSATIVAWVNTGEDEVTRDERRVSRDGINVSNSVWDGQTIRLFGARNEVLNFNVILEAPNGASGVSVSLDSLTGPNGATISSQPASGDGVFSTSDETSSCFSSAIFRSRA